MNKHCSCESTLKKIFFIIGAVVSLAALAVVVYKLFKKYFQVTFECDNCDCCEAFDEESSDYEPICCCDEEEDEEEASDEE